MERYVKAYRENGETIFEAIINSIEESNAIVDWYKNYAGKTADGIYGIIFGEANMHIQMEGNDVNCWIL